MKSGQVKCWGIFAGNLYSNQVVPGLENGIKAIESSGDLACALTEPGGIKCWGNVQFDEIDPYAYLNKGKTKAGSLGAVDVSNIPSEASMLSVSQTYACAIQLNGSVYCWGKQNPQPTEITGFPAMK
jgi:hypothetical protein